MEVEGEEACVRVLPGFFPEAAVVEVVQAREAALVRGMAGVRMMTALRGDAGRVRARSCR